MTSRHRARTTHTQRPEDTPSWTPNEPESGQSRQAMASTQRHNTEPTTGDGHRKHRSSSKRVETADTVAPSAPVASHSKSSGKQRTSAQPSTLYEGTFTGASTTANAAPVATTSSKAHGVYHVDDTPRTRTRPEKPSPRSSNERVALPEDNRSLRPGRTTHTTTVQAPASTQAYYIDPSPVAGEMSSRRRRERDKERDKEQERERRREEKAKARLQEAESLRAQEKERDRDRRRERERELERASGDRDGRRDPERTKERESSRRKEERRAERAALHAAQASSTAAYRPQHADDRPPAVLARHAAPIGQPVQTTMHHTAVPNGNAVSGTSISYHDSSAPATAHGRSSGPSLAPMAVPQRSAERDKSSTRQHRSHRDRVAGQGSGQESGLSSSEQEQSLRERYRPSERRHGTKERKDAHAPSGSETERDSMRDRRKHARTRGDVPGHAKSATESNSKPTEAQLLAANYKASRMQPAAPSQDTAAYRLPGTAQVPVSTSIHASAPPPGQPTALVGLTSQRHVPQIVSIRAGQGPADPQTPMTIPNSLSTTTVNRPREQVYPEPAHPYEPHSYAAPSEYMPHNGDTLKRSRHAQPGAQPTGTVQQPTYGDSAQMNTYNSSAAASYLHPVQQAIRSMDGIGRPPSTRPGAKMSSSAVSAPQVAAIDPSTRYAMNGKEYERQKSTAPGVGAYGQASGQQQAHSTPQYSTSDVRLPGAYPSSPAHVPQHPAPGSYGVPGVVATNSSQNDEKTPRARPAELSLQYQTSTFAPSQNGNVYNSGKAPLSPTTHSITVAQATFAPARPPSATPETKTQWSATVLGGLSSPPPVRPPDARPIPDGQVYQQGAGGHSPGRQPQSHAGRSPGVASTAQLDATPRQFSASHLPTHRNGSTDTIQQSGAAKYSPSLHHNQQTLNHRTSVGSLQPHASSRPDMTPTARSSNVLSGYPEPPTRYRSPAPIPIPYRAPSSGPNLSATPSQSYSAPPSSRPTLPTSISAPAYDPSFMSPRGASVPMVSPQPAGTRGYQPQSTDYNARTQDTYIAAGQRPPRSAPPSAPTVPRQQYDVSSPAEQSSVLAPSSAPPRSSTYPTQQARRHQEPIAEPPVHHSRAASEPHYPASATRPPLVVQTNTSHIKSRSATHAAAAASEQDLLLTPSSLAPSMLPRQHSNASSFLPPGSRGTEQKLAKEKEKDRDSRKRGGFFSGINLFRSRSNPPKPLQESVPDYQRDMRTRKRQDSAPTAPGARPPSDPPANIPQSTRREAYDAVASPRRRDHVDMPVHAAPPTPGVEYLTVPSAGMGVPSAGTMSASRGRSPTKMFSPFRLLSKRHRTVSAASVEAVDGTVANTITGADSTRSSTAGRLSPPLRDPLTAAQEWRNKEEAEFADRGTWRRRRPGVTFDVDADTPERTTTIRAQSRGPRNRQPHPAQEQ